MPLTPQVTITANLQQITGSLDAASAKFELEGFGSTVPRVPGTTVIVQTSTTATADGSGNISVTIWGLDVITPAGCFYNVTFYNDKGGFVASLPYDAFIGTGSFDLSQVVPMGQTVVVAPAAPTSAIPQVFVPVAHNFLTGMNSSGVFSKAQPDYSDLTGTLPLPTSTVLGGVKALAASGGLFLTGIGTDGIPTRSSVSFTIPNPSPTTLGGIESFAAVTHQWINAISTSGVPSATQPAFTDISGTATTAQIPNLDASKITTGLLALARGGTNADLSATGGTSQVLKQVSVGAAVTVGQLAASDLSNGTTGSGAVVLAASPTLTGTTTCSAIISTQTGGGSSAGIQGKAVAPFIAFDATGQAADQKWWDFGANGTTFLGRAVNDANSASTNWLTVTRGSGVAITSIAFQAGGGTQTLPTATDTLVGRTTTDTLTNKTLTSPVISTIVNTGTLTLPTSTDTLVGKATTDTLTNKTLGGAGSTSKDTFFNRFRGTQGTTLTTGDVGSLTGWGNTATVSSVVGTDAACQISIACSGTGQALNPSFVLTFKDGTWINAPIVQITRGEGNGPGAPPFVFAVSATTLTVGGLCQATPVAGTTYSFLITCTGR